MADPKDTHARIRASLESADNALAEALDARARAVQDFIDLRRSDPDGYYTLPRDEEVLARARERAGAFPDEALNHVLREVLSGTAQMAAPVTVAFLGPEGSFAHTAARTQFGSGAQLRPVDTIAELFDEVERSLASFGVIPLETSSDGALTAALDCLVKSDLRISAELTLPASYHLLSVSGESSEVGKIYGAPAAIAHCERHLRSLFPTATVLDVPSAAIAAQYTREDAHAAAVGGDLMAELHSLKIVRGKIEDANDVKTRFAVIGHDHPPRTGADRTVIALAVHDEPGALYKALQPFANRNLNLTRLESRPARDTAFRYIFFVELDGHVTERPVMTAIEELRGVLRFVKVLGSYPKDT